MMMRSSETDTTDDHRFPKIVKDLYWCMYIGDCVISIIVSPNLWLRCFEFYYYKALNGSFFFQLYESGDKHIVRNGFPAATIGLILRKGT